MQRVHEFIVLLKTAASCHPNSLGFSQCLKWMAPKFITNKYWIARRTAKVNLERQVNLRPMLCTLDENNWRLLLLLFICKRKLTLWRPLSPYRYSYKASVVDWVKQSFVIVDIWALWHLTRSGTGCFIDPLMPTVRALWRSDQSVRVPGCQKFQMTA